MRPPSELPKKWLRENIIIVARIEDETKLRTLTWNGRMWYDVENRKYFPERLIAEWDWEHYVLKMYHPDLMPEDPGSIVILTLDGEFHTVREIKWFKTINKRFRVFMCNSYMVHEDMVKLWCKNDNKQHVDDSQRCIRLWP